MQGCFFKGTDAQPVSTYQLEAGVADCLLSSVLSVWPGQAGRQSLELSSPRPLWLLFIQPTPLVNL